jgi:hypothetical protein
VSGKKEYGVKAKELGGLTMRLLLLMIPLKNIYLYKYLCI